MVNYRVMMKSNISKTLLEMVSRITAELNARGERSSYKDRLMTVILTDDATMAHRTLSTLMQEWQIESLVRNILRDCATKPITESTTPESYYSSLCDFLRRSIEARNISTIHILYIAAADGTTATSRRLMEYGINAEDILCAMARLTGEDSSIGSTPQLHVAPIRNKSEKSSLIEKYGQNLTTRARHNEIDPVIGRDEEIERVVQILSRRRKCNPMLIGEAGVGKSAIVEGLALRMVEGRVPRHIADKELYTLDLAALVAGTKFRGEFEERASELIASLERERNVILFIDEIHSVVGAGATQGTLDLSNILKPALARGTILVIGATTPEEYRPSIERDAALERRFQPVKVTSMSEERTLEILHRLAMHYGEHHGVTYSDEALEAAVRLSSRYITSRHLPDKAIDLIDEAGARLQIERGVTNEPNMIVTRGDIERVVHEITGIPTTRIGESERSRLGRLRDYLQEGIIGQREAIGALSRAIIRSRSGLGDEHRPWGIFLFVGPTGVGKTRLATKLAEWIDDRRMSLIRLNMSEYREAHTISRLIGSPPGFVGYGEGGELTEPIRRNPHSVILFDEIEKAHPDIFNLLLQIGDEGRLTDGMGRDADFRHSIIILTSNSGSARASENRVGYRLPSTTRNEKSKSSYMRAVEGLFSPELMNRIDEVVIFDHLSLTDIERIVDIEIEELRRRFQLIGGRLSISERAKRHLARRSYDTRYGARALKRLIAELVETPLAQLIVERGSCEGEELHIEFRGGGIELRAAQQSVA